MSSLKGKVELVSRIGKEPVDSLTQQADGVYQLGSPALREQNFDGFLIMKDKVESSTFYFICDGTEKE